VDPGRAPEGIGKAHVTDQLANFERHLWPAAARPRVFIVNSVPLAQSRESGDGPSHEGCAQNDLVSGHWALQITSLS
jgi:hypothetical protein